MTVTVNGELREIPEGLSVAELLQELGIRTGRIAVELNREVLPRDLYGTRRLADGDVVEIVHFIGGG
ncbi:MAG: sulfur carrier protein ThiS [Candidatus Binatia bacterium]|nr:MAG: sulfur carrier protein ThiS [Candidatus Binatia bacterium]